MEIISISTGGETDFVDITPEVEKVIASSGVKEGVALIYKIDWAESLHALAVG